jgi:hypothetical protein
MLCFYLYILLLANINMLPPATAEDLIQIELQQTWQQYLEVCQGSLTEEARQALLARGLTAEDIEQYGLGLHSAGLFTSETTPSIEQLEAAGLPRASQGSFTVNLTTLCGSAVGNRFHIRHFRS